MTYKKNSSGFTYDKNGTQLKVGDTVSVEFRILSLTVLDEQNCDLSLETVSGIEIDKYQDKFCPQINVNSKQTEKISRFSGWVALDETDSNNDVIISEKVAEYFNNINFNKIKFDIVDEIRVPHEDDKCDPKPKPCLRESIEENHSDVNFVCGFDPSKMHNVMFNNLEINKLISKGSLEHLSSQYKKPSHTWNFITRNHESWPKDQNEMYWVLRDGKLLSDFPCFIDNENRFLCKTKQLTKPWSLYVYEFEVGDEWCVFESTPPGINR